MQKDAHRHTHLRKAMLVKSLSNESIGSGWYLNEDDAEGDLAAVFFTTGITRVLQFDLLG